LKCGKDFRVGRNICKRCNIINDKLQRNEGDQLHANNTTIITTKICSKCKITKSVSDFYKQYENIYKSECKKCSIKYREDYIKTLNGYFVKLLAAAKGDAKKRTVKGRVDAGIFDITVDDLNDLWNNQKGLCYYSKLPMNYDKNEWKVSLERLNNKMGYTRDNICLVCLEFNGPCQWSHLKILEMMNILNKNIQNNSVDFTTKDQPIKHRKKIIRIVIDGLEHYKCTRCDQVKPVNDYNSKINNGCKDCISIKNKRHTATPHGHMQKLLNSAKGSTRTRNKKNNTRRDSSFDITFDYLTKLFNKQKGLCAYSGIPLQFGSYLDKNWTASLERKDPFKGYTIENVCLICWEFNIFDKSLLYKSNNENVGWTKEKFKLFYERIKSMTL
jgi:hypothetical protein